MKYLRYLWYVLKHKWFVFVECCRLGIPWQGIIHDFSKFLPDEFFPYAQYFYGEKSPKKTASFKFAWLLHQKRNPHHWQWWLEQSEMCITEFDMSVGARKEMLADWNGAGKAQGFGNNTAEWYEKNKNKMILHADTRRWIEENIPAAF